uniref:ATP synthase F0 subunit 8 n=1 Tax=Bangia fuscopurpurea TaxID=101920 RepID=A0A0E3JXP6_BANFU|nr:ATP synthase F0 subunit 8 [Bangia fuscopurpurea]AKA66493.1 ATP synthase F0 subunit 8 [Bangia fuscopurpurea]
MPQLDRVVIFTQIFWLFSVFLIAYISYTHFVLSSLLKIFLVRWWKLRKDITQIALKLRLTKFLVNSNIQLLRKIYFVVKNVLLSLAKSLSENHLSKSKLYLSDLNSLVLKVSVETSLYTSKSITKSGTYSHWTQ